MTPRIGYIAAWIVIAVVAVATYLDVTAAWGLPRSGGVALAVLIIAATLWITEAIPLFVTSLLVSFLGTTCLMPTLVDQAVPLPRDAFFTPFFSDIIALFLGGFVLSAGLHKFQLDQWLAQHMIRQMGGSLPWLMLGIMITTAFLSMWLSNTATAAMMLSLVLPIVASLPADSRYRQSILLSVPFAANIGGLGTPIGSPPNAIAMQYMSQVDLQPSFLQWLAIGVPGVVCMLAIGWGVLLFISRGAVGTFASSETALQLKCPPQMWIVVATAAVTIAGWVTSSLHGQSSGTVALIPVLVFFGLGVLNVKDLRSLSWDVLLLMGGGLCLGKIISVSGLAAWLVAGLPVQGISAFWLMVMFGSLACFMSSVMSNTATANLIMPILLGLDVQPLSPLLIGTAFACSLAMPLPVSTPPNAMAFSSGQLKVTDLLRPGLLLTVVGVALAFTTGYWWWQRIGLF